MYNGDWGRGYDALLEDLKKNYFLKKHLEDWRSTKKINRIPEYYHLIRNDIFKSDLSQTVKYIKCI